jgi:hypothetical protein
MAAQRRTVPGPCLTSHDIQGFVRDGFVRLDAAFLRSTAEEAREILWRDTGCDQLDRTTWTRPVIRLGSYFDPPFRAAANAPRLSHPILEKIPVWLPSNILFLVCVSPLMW